MIVQQALATSVATDTVQSAAVETVVHVFARGVTGVECVERGG